MNKKHQASPQVEETETQTPTTPPVETKTKIRFTCLVLHNGKNYAKGNTLEIDKEELENIPKAWYEVVNNIL